MSKPTLRTHLCPPLDDLELAGRIIPGVLAVHQMLAALARVLLAQALTFFYASTSKLSKDAKIVFLKPGHRRAEDVYWLVYA
jgi:hypothetical protein